MKQETGNIAATIQSVAKNGKVGSLFVKKAETTFFIVENNAKTARWLVEADTGLAFEPRGMAGLDMVANALVNSQHCNTQFEIKAVNTSTKWFEVCYLYLPLSVHNVSVYEGVFSATKLDFVDSKADLPLTPAGIIGLSDDDVPNPTPARLWNVTGSIKNDDKVYNRRVEDEFGVMEFNSNDGRYRFTKSAACKAFEAPLVGMQSVDIRTDDIVTGLLAAPSTTMSEVLENYTRCHKRKQ